MESLALGFWWDLGGIPADWGIAARDYSGNQGAGGSAGGAGRQGALGGWGTQEDRRHGRTLKGRSAAFRGTRHAGRFRIGAAVDLQERAQAGRRTQAHGASDKPSDGRRVNCTNDFVIPELGRAAPYGLYDVANNTVGECRRRPLHVGFRRRDDSPLVVRNGATRLSQSYTTSHDSGGSNGSRVRLWKVELQRLANEIHLQAGFCAGSRN